jgi:hypothetical protein
MKVKTMRGKPLDMARLMAQNQYKIALGNASMNARGDIVEGGKVVKPREEIARDYHRNNPKAVKQVALRNISDLSEEVFMTPVEALNAAKQEGKFKKRKLTDTED